MKYILASLMIFLGVSSASAITCYSSYEELREAGETAHAYHTNKVIPNEVCWHVNKIVTAKITKKQIKKPTTIAKNTKTDTKTEKPQSDTEIYRLTPEQGRLLMDLLFPELPTLRY